LQKPKKKEKKKKKKNNKLKTHKKLEKWNFGNEFWKLKQINK
jgi:hypothetical protein